MRLEDFFLDPTADNIQVALKFIVINTARIGDHDLFNFRPRGVGFFTNNTGIHRHLPPPINIIAERQYFSFNDGPAGFLAFEIRSR